MQMMERWVEIAIARYLLFKLGRSSWVVEWVTHLDPGVIREM